MLPPLVPSHHLMTSGGHLFPSSAWIDAFADGLAAHPRAPDVARALNGVYRFVIEPAGPLDIRHSYDVAIQPDGDAASVLRLPDPVPEPRMTLTADYERWRQLIERRLDVGLAVLTRRLRISGDLAGLRSGLGDTRPLLDALSEVHTVWRA